MLTSRDAVFRDLLLPPSGLAAEKFPRPVAFALPTDSMGRLLDLAKEPRVIQVSPRATNEIDDGLVSLLIDKKP